MGKSPELEDIDPFEPQTGNSQELIEKTENLKIERQGPKSESEKSQKPISA